MRLQSPAVSVHLILRHQRLLDAIILECGNLQAYVDVLIICMAEQEGALLRWYTGRIRWSRGPRLWHRDLRIALHVVRA